MAWEPGQSGNPKGRSKEKIFFAALNRAITQDDGKRIRMAIESLLDAAADGQQWAIKELRDTLDGKPAQSIVGDDENPLTLIHKIERVILDGSAD